MAETSRFWNGTVTGDATEAPYDANTEFANYVRQTIGLGNTRANAGVVLGNGSESTQLDSLQVTQNSPAGMSVLLNIGNAIVRGTSYDNDSALTLSISANASGNARIDTVVLRKVWATQTVRAVVLAGTPAASPTPPSLTQSDGVTWEIAIADVAVANGAVSITNSNITSRASYTNAADGIYLDRLNNNSGATLQTGDVVGLDATADRAVTSAAATALARLQRVGVWTGRNAAASVNGRVVNRGICRVRTSAAVTIGQYVVADVGAATVSGSTIPTLYAMGQFLETTSGAGLALAYIEAGLPDTFGYIVGSDLSAPAAAITVTFTQSPYMTLVLEYQLRSEVVATGDNVYIQFATPAAAANYSSYTTLTGNSTPATSAVQNLSATPGIVIFVPGASASSGLFCFGKLEISRADVATGGHHISGRYYAPTANTNGTLLIGQIGGRYSITGAINRISLITASGANLFTGSYINVYAKQ